MPQAAIPAIIGGVASIGGSLISSHGARAAARHATPSPYSVFGPAGGVQVDKNGRAINLSMGSNPFAALFQQLGMGQLSAAGGAQNRYLYGANPEVGQAYQGLFGPRLAGQVQDQYSLLSQLAAPGEQRDQVALDDRLFSRGMLGTSGGAEQLRALEEAHGQADLQRQLQAVGLGRQTALDRFTGAMGAVGQGMGAQQQQFNIGNGAFGGYNQLFENLLRQAGLGVGAMSGQPQEAAMYAAQQSQAPWQAGFNFLQNSGLFNGGFGAPGTPFYQQQPIYAGGGAPMLPQPGGPVMVG